MSLAEPKSPTGDAEPKLVNGEVNGVSNGHSEGSKHKSSSHKSSSKDKHRDKDRTRKEHRSSKSHHSSSSSSHRDRDKDHKSSHSSHKSSSKDKDRDRERDKDRSKDKSKDHKSSSKDKDREKERGKEHKNSSKDKDRHSSSSKDKHRDKDRHKSSSKDKHRDRDRHREHKSSSKDKRRDSEKHKKEEKVENGQQQQPPIVSEEPKITNECQVSIERYRPEPVEDPLDNSQASQASSCDYTMSQFKANEPEFDIKEEASDETDGETPSTKRKQIIESDNEEEEEEKPLSVRKKLKEENSDEEDAPLISRKKIKNESDDEAKPLSARIKTTIESDEEAPLLQRKKKMDKKKKKRMESDEDDFEDERPKKKKVKKEKAKDSRAKVKTEEPITPVKGGRKKKDEEEQEVWKWWEEEKRADGVKWNFLEHKGPVFAPDYEPLPKNVHFEYDGKVVKLSQDAEEVAGFYAKMLESDYCQKKQFNENFFKDWRKVMSSSEKNLIKEFKKCNFKKMHAYFAAESEKNRNRSKEEKKALKEKNDEILKEYGMCTIDGHKEKIGNFKIEPPGLFRGRGEHPKMGMLKRRVLPSDITINCSKGSKWPKPPEGTRWKEVRHDNSVTWLASWTENVQNQVKYIMLNPSSKLKGEKDWQKYETARKLLKHIDQIRATYRDEWKSKEMRIRQRAVALYFIDKLALRAGNEKDEDQADTVGCCSLRVEHIELFREKDGKEYVVVFDFLGKDSIRYYNEVEVEKRVFKNLELFKENKKDGDDLFDRLNTSVLNEHLRELMEGLTAKVFRTFNASYTLQKQLDELTDPDMSVPEKLLAYNRANRAVAILCNHQRAVPKTHQKSMETLKEKIRLKREAVDECEREYKDLKRGNPALREKKKKQLERLKEQLKKLELQETDRDENKTIALGTSKLNYLDPRISVAWCKKFGVPIEKIFNKTQRDKFRWAIDMAGPEYVF